MSILLESIARHAKEIPDKRALSGNDSALTYADLPKAVAARQAILQGRGIRVLGLQLPNGPEWILWDLAALFSGTICVPIPAFFTDEQVSHIVKATGIEEILTDSGFLKTGHQMSKSIPAGTTKITFTSGTTGAPKGVCLPQDGLEQVASSLAQTIGKQYAGRHLSVMPLSILLENIAGVYTALIEGATIYLPDSADIGMGNPFQPDFGKLISFVRGQNITSMILVPELLRALIRAAVAAGPQSLSSLSFVAVGGSKVSPALIEAAHKLNIPVYEGYGLSECGSVVALNTPAAEYGGTVGSVLPHVDLHIRDGEIVVDNPVFLGYLGEPPRGTAPFATGDLGAFEGHRILKINGRKKNIIITSQGRNISPEWVESVFLTQPEIAQIVVYGDNLAYPAALIAPAAADADLSSAIERANRLLPEYAQVKTYQVVPPFTPKNGLLTATGRPRRTEIFSHYQSIMTKEDNDDILRQAG